MRCDTSAFFSSGEMSTTYASVPQDLHVGHVVNSQCINDNERRFGIGTTTESIKCTAQHPVGVLNQPPTGCRSMSICTLSGGAVA